MTFTLSPPVRIVALLGLLAAVLVGRERQAGHARLGRTGCHFEEAFGREGDHLETHDAGTAQGA